MIGEENSAIDTAIKSTADALENISCILVLIATLLLLISIINRALRTGIVGIQSFAQVIGIYITFLIIPKLAINDRHITVEYFYSKASPRTQTILSTFDLVLSILVTLIIAVSSILAVIEFRDVSPAGLWFSSSWFYAAVMIGFVSITSVYIHEGIQYLSDDKAIRDRGSDLYE